MANPWIVLLNVQSIPLNPTLQLHDPPVSHFPPAGDTEPPLHLSLSPSQLKSGHLPSLSNATLPGHGVAVVVGLPLNIYRN